MACRWKDISPTAKNRLLQPIQSEQELYDLEKQDEKTLHEIHVEYFEWKTVFNFLRAKKMPDWSSLYLPQYVGHLEIASL